MTNFQKFMRGLSRQQAAYILGVTPQAVQKWIDNGPSPLAEKACEWFLGLSAERQATLRELARLNLPNKWGKVF